MKKMAAIAAASPVKVTRETAVRKAFLTSSRSPASSASLSSRVAPTLIIVAKVVGLRLLSSSLSSSLMKTLWATDGIIVLRDHVSKPMETRRNWKQATYPPNLEKNVMTTGVDQQPCYMCWSLGKSALTMSLDMVFVPMFDQRN